jgi:hypothetical protein
MASDMRFCRNCGASLAVGASSCPQCGAPLREQGPISGSHLSPGALPPQGQFIGWIVALVDKFRQSGATSPEKAMTAKELGLGPRFEMAMQRRLGHLGIFVQVDGRYYLSEERLKELRAQPGQRRRF